MIFLLMQCAAFTVFTLFTPLWAMQRLCFYHFPPFTSFRAMQRLCFYHFHSFHFFSGNAAPLLLPFFLLSPLFGQCSGSPFTLFTLFTSFRAMQRNKDSLFDLFVRGLLHSGL
ncbi:hypothetical protein [Mesobacillus jeotgali]|uniref:hypothetical protein n=1 Tax=Mesobacillus jeotgali TaxID=129985 RepID=UPI00131549C1|nr:hypothetical protein [Mesobacillus jeotgali]